MVEPAGSVILNTLLHGRSTFAHRSSASLSRTMSRPCISRVQLTPGFFNPRRPRSVKGKERMTDDSARLEVLALYAARCQDWSIRMRLSVWCLEGPMHASRSTAEEDTRKRPRGPRRSRKMTSLPPVFHRGQARHASHTSERPPPEPDPPCSPGADEDAAPPEPPAAISAASDSSSLQFTDSSQEGAPDPAGPPVLDDISETDSPPAAETEILTNRSSKLQTVAHLLRLLNQPRSQMQLDEIWPAYEAVETQVGFQGLTVPELLGLAEALLNFVESRSQIEELDELHQWGMRVRQMLDSVSSAAASTQTLRNLMARALALEGDLQKALDILHEDRPEYVNFGPFLRVYEAILVSTWRHFDRIRALEFLILEWKIIGSYLLTETSRVHSGAGSIAAAGESLRQTAFVIVSAISLPSLVLADKQLEWDEQQRRHLGDLLIEAFFRSELPMESVDVLREMRRQHIKPSQHLPLHLVRVLARNNHYSDAHALYGSIPEQQAYDYLFTGLYLHAHEGKDQKAIEYFNRITAAGWRNSKTVLELMYAYAVQGRAQETLQIFQEYFPEDSEGVPSHSPLIEHFAVGVFAHAQRGDFGGTVPWLESMRKVGLKPEAYIFTTILRSFALRGDLESIAQVMDQMRQAGHPPNRVTYTTVMTLLAHRKDPASTEAIYARAIREGVVPDSMMIATVMNAHIEAGSWKGVIRAFDFIRSSPHMKLTIGIYNLLLKAYLQIGAPFRIVSRVFNQLERLRIRPDAYTFALLIQSACDSRLMKAASDIFTEMERLSEHWGSSRHITTWTMTILMAGYLRRGDNDSAIAIYEDMARRGLKPTAVTYGVIISAYGVEGTEDSYKLAENFIKELTSRTPEERTWETPSHGRLSARDRLYIPLMQSYARRRMAKDVERVYNEMLADGGEPTLSILGVLLDVYARVHDVDNVLKVWPQIFHLGVKYSTIPLFENESGEQGRSKMHTYVLCVPLSKYISTLSAAGMHDEIATVWKTFQAHGFSFSADNWNQLAMALLRAGEVERCFEVLEKVLLPWHRRSNRLRKERDPHPNSPLSLNVPPRDQRPLEKPLVGKARSEAVKWQRYHRRASDELGEQHADDLAHHLHVLHRISPMWNTWQPRHDVLRGLFEVLLRLRAGYPANADTPNTDDLSMDPAELQQRIDDARARLNAIYTAYPDAVGSVSKFERDERRRLGRWFTKVYTWGSV